jgi:CRISPR system Cascade subunit CasC
VTKGDKEEIEKARAACAKLIARGEVARAIKGVQLKDAADIALFGRMVANDHSLMVEGAAMFSHALSTHKVDNEIDFFSALRSRVRECEISNNQCLSGSRRVTASS